MHVFLVLALSIPVATIMIMIIGKPSDFEGKDETVCSPGQVRLDENTKPVDYAITPFPEANFLLLALSAKDTI